MLYRGREIFLSISLVLMLFIFSSFVSGVGIGKYDTNTQMLFHPGIEQKYSFSLFDSKNISASLDGDLVEYTSLIDPNPNGGTRNVDIVIKLPEYLEPGIHRAYLVASEVAESEATIGAFASVRTGVTVFALYPGKHPEFYGLAIKDFNFNEKTSFDIPLKNLGEETIDSVSGELTIYNDKDEVVGTVNTNSKKADAYESVSIGGIIDGSLYNMPVGSYRAVATITFDGQVYNKTLETTFIVGKMNVDIIETTKEVIVNATNKYYITIESDWSGDINNVYAKITMPSGKTVKAPSVDLIKNKPGEKAVGVMQTYVETNDLPIGTYTLPITVYYNGLTTQKNVKVNVINGIAPVIVKPKLINISTNTLIIIVSAVVVLGIIIYLLIFWRGGSGGSTVSKNNSSSISSSDIRPPTL